MFGFIVFKGAGSRKCKVHTRTVYDVTQIKFHYQMFLSILQLLKIHMSVNLLAFYHDSRSLIGYATRYLFCDSESHSSEPLLAK